MKTPKERIQQRLKPKSPKKSAVAGDTVVMGGDTTRIVKRRKVSKVRKTARAR